MFQLMIEDFTVAVELLDIQVLFHPFEKSSMAQRD